jgi:two-component sensor histidine kinase
MSSLSDRLSQGAVSPTQVDHARRLVADWQLLADLAFADLTLWVPLPTGAWWCVAQVRPLTAPTSRPEDLVGAEVDGAVAEPFLLAHREGRPVTEGEPDWSGAAPRRREVIPVRHDGVVVAVLAKDTNLAVTRSPSTLELTYLDIAADLCLMVSAGTFPPEKLQDAEMSPRVGDGLVRLDDRGRVTYASPNALSAYRRIGVAGDLLGGNLAELTRGATVERVAGEAAAAGILAALAGRFPDPMDVEGVSATMFVRALPLQAPGGEAGALVLVRDVTDVRRRDRALLTKDATIREIHHRVKNNLQTVAALLRLQARRMTEPAARAALEESVRRVASIAVVHETLAGSREDVVAVDDVLDQVLPMLGDLTSVGPAARTRRTGSFGELPAAAATPLVLAVTELLHNAAEHAFPDGEPGSIELVAERQGDDLVVRVRDNGRGLPDGFDSVTSEGLGLQIVRTLVMSELGGSLEMTSPPTAPADGRRGPEVVLTVPGVGRARR